MKTSTRLACLSVVVVLLVLANSHVASASHFRYGTLDWQQDLTYSVAGSYKVHVSLDAAFRRSFFNPLPNLNDQVVGETVLTVTGTSGVLGTYNLPAHVVQIDAAQDLFYGVVETDFVFPISEFPLRVTFSDCCRITTLLEGNANQTYTLTMIIDPTKGTRSPQSTSQAVIFMTQGQVNTVFIPTVAFDNLVNFFEFAPTSASGLLTPAPNGTAQCSGGCPNDVTDPLQYPDTMALNPNGTITWTPQVAGLYAAQFKITSITSTGVRKNAVPLDLMFSVAAPPCTGCEPTISPANPPPVTVAPGQLATFTLTATSTLPNAVLSMSSTPLPSGATFVTQPVSSTAINGVFSWTPTSTDPSAVVCFTATASAPPVVLSSAGMVCVTINVVTTTATSLSSIVTSSSAFVAGALTASTKLTSVPAGSPLAGQPVVFTLAGPAGTSTLTGPTDASGTASVIFTPTVRGAHSVSAAFAGTATLLPSTSNTAAVSVYQRTSLAMPASANATAGSATTLTATLTSVPQGTPLGGQAVTFSFAGPGALPPSQTAFTNLAGVASISVTFASTGSVIATASFLNTADFFADQAGTFVATVASTQVSVVAETTVLSDLSAPSVWFVDQPVPTISTRLTRTPLGAPVPGQTIVFRVTAPGGAVTTLNATTDANGTASVLFFYVRRGPHTVSATFAGTDALTPSNSNAPTITVYQKMVLSLALPGGNTSFAGSPVTVRAVLATVPYTGEPLSGQTVTLSFTGGLSSQTVATDEFGSASVTVTFPTPGVQTVTGSFLNAAEYYTNHLGAIPISPELATVTVTIIAAPTSLAALSVNPVDFVGNNLTVTTVLSRASDGSALPGKPVSFTLTGPGGGTTLTALTDGAGIATAVFSPTARGQHSVSAAFAGNGAYAASASAPASVAVYQRTLLSAASSFSGVMGSPIAVSATLTSVPSGAPVAGQTVMFSFGGVLTAQSAITNAAGVASISVSLATAGTVNGTASFLNTADFFADNAGSPIAQTVSFSVTAVDTLPPVISSVTPSVAVLDPPNKKMVPVTVNVVATDDSGGAPVCSITSVTNDEDNNPADAQITGALSLQLRADRDPHGNGRVYTINVTCRDASNNAATASTTVTVPKGKK